jgi:hypothetical protein
MNGLQYFEQWELKEYRISSISNDFLEKENVAKVFHAKNQH